MGFAEKARPLYERSKETPNWTWTEPMKQAFQTLRQALLEAPALALPNPNKPFQLFIEEKQKIRKGVLTQQWGPWKWPVTYLSKRLDPVASGWPPCLHIIAATALLVRDADKLTFGQQLWVYNPHAIKGVLKQPPVRCWLRPWQLENLILPAILGCHLCEHLHTTIHLGEKKDLDTSPDGLPEVPSTKCNCTRDNPDLQSMPADEDREKAAHRNEVQRERARETLRDRFH